MKGYRIDPKARRITEVTLGDHYEEINESIGSRFFCQAHICRSAT